MKWNETKKIEYLECEIIANGRSLNSVFRNDGENWDFIRGIILFYTTTTVSHHRKKMDSSKVVVNS